VAATRRPDPGRRTAARAATRAQTRGSSTEAVTRRPAGLTTRAAILGLVVCALVVSAALPLREFLSQRGDIRRLEQSEAAARHRVTALEEQKARLSDPAYVAALARDRLHFLRPGESAYVVIAPTAPAAAPKDAKRAADAAVGPNGPWYSQLWGSVRSADRPVQVRAGK
jgi:cell division protein FtsB